MKRPLAAVTLVYVSGLFAGDFFPLPPDIILPLAFAFAALTLFALLYRREFTAEVLLWPLIGVTGWANISCQTTPLSPHDLRNLDFEPAELVILRGKLSETPSQRLFVQDEKESYRFLANLRCSEIRRHKRVWQPASGSVLILTPGILPREFFAGQEVEISGVLSKPPGPTLEGLFDYGAYLRRQSIYYQLKTEGTNDWKTLSEGLTPPLSDRFLTWAQKALSVGLPAHDDPLKMLLAMTLGWKTVNNEIYEPFMKSGTMHVFAISGLHIALIAGICVALLRVTQVPRNWCGMLVVPLIWFYTGATGWQASAIRSTIMMSVIIGGWALSRPADLLNSLAASAMCILVWDPQQLFGAGFQLSFFVVLSIGLLLPPFEKMRDQWLKTDPMLPQALVPEWKRGLLLALRWLTNSMAISLAAWIGSIPITAYYFHLLSPVALVANLVIVPLSSCALAANLGSLICAPWLSGASVLFNHSAWLCMRLMIDLSKWCAAIPFACSWVSSPSVVVMVLYYAFLMTVISGRVLALERRWILSGILLSAIGYEAWRWNEARFAATLTVAPLSGGFSVYAHHPRYGPDLLVDSGRSNAVQFSIGPFLHAHGCDDIDAFVLTHGDIRHMGGAGLLVADFQPKKVYASSLRFRSAAYRECLLQFERRQQPVDRLERGHEVGAWRVLHPNSMDRFTQADDGSLVLKGVLNGVPVLLVGDLGEKGQIALLERYPELRADVIVTGLPSRAEPVSDPFIDRVKPRLIVIGDSEFPVSERASKALQQRLRKKGVPVIYTRLTGSVTISTESSGTGKVHDSKGNLLKRWGPQGPEPL